MILYKGDSVVPVGGWAANAEDPYKPLKIAKITVRGIKQRIIWLRAGTEHAPKGKLFPYAMSGFRKVAKP